MNDQLVSDFLEALKARFPVIDRADKLRRVYHEDGKVMPANVEPTEIVKEILKKSNVPEGSDFCTEIPYESVLLNEVPSSHIEYYNRLILRRLIKNENVSYKPLNLLDKISRGIKPKIPFSRIHNTDRVIRNILADSGLVLRLNSCSSEFSLVGRFETYGPLDEEKDFYRMDRYFLIVPGEKDASWVKDWRHNNTQPYKKNRCLPGFHRV